jgi:hypothetical protein
MVPGQSETGFGTLLNHLQNVHGVLRDGEPAPCTVVSHQMVEKA